MAVAVTQHDPSDDAPPSAETAHTPPETDGELPDRLQALSHELRSMLDGSLRWLSLASKGLPEIGDGPASEDLERTRRQLEHVRESLVQMTEIIAAAGRFDIATETAKKGYRSLVASVTLREAIDHAIAVIRPEAAEMGVTIGISATDDVSDLSAGPMYSLILNGLRNALESIAQATGGQPGEGIIRVSLKRAHKDGRDVAELSISDDGVGPPALDETRTVFDVGYSTRTGECQTRGLGLSLSREIVRELGGSIELVEGKSKNPLRPGAALRATWPIDEDGPGA
ncbi:MAG: HAMP domain-containing sensor histidine kinase [Planctomycetota bacterium]